MAKGYMSMKGPPSGYPSTFPPGESNERIRWHSGGDNCCAAESPYKRHRCCYPAWVPHDTHLDSGWFGDYIVANAKFEWPNYEYKHTEVVLPQPRAAPQSYDYQFDEDDLLPDPTFEEAKTLPSYEDITLEYWRSRGVKNPERL